MDKMAMPLLTTGYTAKQQASAAINILEFKNRRDGRRLVSLYGSTHSG